MKTYFLLLILSQTVAASQPSFDAAQRPTVPPTNYPYSDLGSTAALIFIVVVSAAFFTGFFAIYIRHCFYGDTVDGAIPLYSAAASRPRWLSPSGLDPAVVNSFPILKYSEIKHLKMGKGELSCAVCVSEFEDNETLRLLPKCDHVFHPECIDLWLASHSTCPICRAYLSKAIESTQSTAECCDSRPEVSEAPIPNQSSITVDEIETAPSERVRVFPRPHSTGHSLVRLGENWERHTLRLPEEARRPVDRLDRGGTSDKRSSMTPPFFTRTGSLRAAKVGVADGLDFCNGIGLELALISKMTTNPPLEI
ncbi:hypothetical protein RHSIM_Rhsim08G0014100 [Rhododendron simsii]|uniref:RING-type E3 ubiquitin transferase n=1 Tax=Rhododendron simsii TaxID=118357 RepID=A0A834GIS1_RHOSS|nr:hypothetical protein RHSIM_Rhsim08G0014100 [Rhododendron simsii]